MQISDIKISFIQSPHNGLIGFTSMVLGGSFYVSGIGIHEMLDGQGYRLTYPTKRSGEQIFNICHPTNRPLSRAIEQSVFQKIKAVKNERCEANVTNKSHIL